MIYMYLHNNFTLQGKEDPNNTEVHFLLLLQFSYINNLQIPFVKCFTCQALGSSKDLKDDQLIIFTNQSIHGLKIIKLDTNSGNHN